MNLNEKFELLSKETGLTQKDVARAIGKGESLVNGILRGSYESKSKEKYEASINYYFDEMIANLNLKQGNESINLDDESLKNSENEPWLSLAQSKIKERIEAMLSSKISFFELIFGESGMGKTYLLKHICSNKDDALYIKARKSLSCSAFMSLILKHLNVKPKGNTDDKLDLVIKSLEEKEIRLLVIDESDLFVGDNKNTFERKFELLREIFEYFKDKKVGICVVCVGLKELKTDIDSLGGYIKSRFTYSPEMTLSHDELLKIGKLNGLSDEMCEYLVDDNNARTFEKTRVNIDLGYDEKTAANLVYTVRG
ncbi:MAG: AAA family ATPase [Campylobacter sp.]|uniref:AAA family ATPase n=1 Tax=Campylobacter ureolyticus TaxID=827 RepID=UPI0022B348A3|nr:AAA family ATPase [Campylobacter ureolyticus]MCI6988340.1 AAA family ATPase [Campylobacter sp.]MCZ6156981.1 AAA family ATPase [Campylobacter ureolyticus]